MPRGDIDRMTTMHASELLQRIESSRAPLIVDARSEVEFKRAHVKGAVNVPMRKLLLHSAYLPPDKGRAVVFTCDPGERTAAANALLSRYGYRNAEFLEGGPDEWKAACLPLVTGDFHLHGLGVAVDRDRTRGRERPLRGAMTLLEGIGND